MEYQKKLRIYMAEKDYSCKYMADLCGVSCATIGLWRNGRIKRLPLDSALHLIDVTKGFIKLEDCGYKKDARGNYTYTSSYIPKLRNKST